MGELTERFRASVRQLTLEDVNQIYAVREILERAAAAQTRCTRSMISFFTSPSSGPTRQLLALGLALPGGSEGH